MDSIKATWTNGQIMPQEAIVWPEGTELLVEPAIPFAVGLQESQWRSDAQAIADWENWLSTIEPRILTDQERADLMAYEAEHRRFNLDAVRQQMASGDGA
jgi:hypothetical protein